jgi:hypothetical protein
MRGVIGAVAGSALVCAALVGLISFQSFEAGKQASEATVQQRLKIERESAFAAGKADGAIEAVALYVGGVDVDWAKEVRDKDTAKDEAARGPVCRVTSNVRPSKQSANGQPAAPRECRLLRDGSLWIPNWRTPS